MKNYYLNFNKMKATVLFFSSYLSEYDKNGKCDKIKGLIPYLYKIEGTEEEQLYQLNYHCISLLACRKASENNTDFIEEFDKMKTKYLSHFFKIYNNEQIEALEEKLNKETFFYKGTIKINEI